MDHRPEACTRRNADQIGIRKRVAEKALIGCPGTCQSGSGQQHHDGAGDPQQKKDPFRSAQLIRDAASAELCRSDPQQRPEWDRNVSEQDAKDTGGNCTDDQDKRDGSCFPHGLYYTLFRKSEKETNFAHL